MIRRPAFAPVANIQQLRALEKMELAGDYHLLLAHHVLEYEYEFRDLFRDIRAQGRQPFVIMDNSLIELGESLAPNDLLRACRIVGANALVLADVLGDGKATLEASIGMANKLKWRRSEGCKLLYVVQGKDHLEALEGVSTIVKYLGGHLGYLSVPRIIANTHGTRTRIIDVLRRNWPELPIHLLGFSNDLYDDFMSLRTSGVMGIDSATPIWLGQQKRLLTPHIPACNPFGSRPEDFWQINRDSAGKVLPQVLEPETIYNVVTIRKLWLKESSRA